MGFLYKLGRIRSYILIILFFVAFIISGPVKRKVTSAVDAQLSILTKTLHDSTGISIVYKSMSPSILSNFLIKEIHLMDDDNKQYVSVERAKISFSLGKLIKRDMYNVVSAVTIEGIDLDVDRIINLVNKVQTSMDETDVDYSQIQKMIPSHVKVKNVKLSYEDNSFETEVEIKTINLSNDLKKEVLNVQLDSLLHASIFNLNKKLSGKLSLNGRLNHHLDNSQVNIKLADLNDGNYHLNKLNLHMGYENSKVSLQTIQSAYPISIALDYNINTEDFNGQIRTEYLSPLSLLSVSPKQKELKKLKNVSLNTDTIIKCNISDKSLNFISDSDIYIPDELFPGGFTLDFTVFGNEKNCELSKFRVDGENINASAELSYVYKNYQLAGVAELNNYLLKNNNSVSTELYFDPLDNGFMAFSPQLFVGQKAFTALQFKFLPGNDSYDFNFEAYDYSHIEDTEPGFVQLDGSYLKKSKYVQTNIGLNSLYLDSVADLFSQFLESDKSELVQKYMSNLSPYMFSGDVYASTDLKSISYNIPYVLIANTQKDNQFLMLSLNGSEQNVQLNQFSLILGKYAVEAAATFDINSDTKDMFYMLDLNAASIPYHFSGSIMQNLITVTGDYGTAVEIKLGADKQVDGYALLESIPVSILEKSMLFSLDSRFHYDLIDGPEFQINRFEAELADGTVIVSPKISLAGNMTKYGAQLNSLAYTDMYSTLEGTSDLMINVNENVFDSVGIILNMKNPLSDEGIIIDGSISNPEHLQLTAENMLKYIYLNLQIQLNSFGLNRFGLQPNDNNRITASLNSSGTLEHPYLSVNIEDSSILLSTEFLKLKGSLILEDRDFSINDLYVNYDYMNIHDVQANASLNTMTLDATGIIDCNLMDKTVYAPLNLSISNTLIPEGKYIPDSFMANITVPEVSGSMIKKKFPVSLSFLYSDKLFNIYSSDNCGVSGTYTTDGILDLTIDNKDFIKANLAGLVNNSQMALQLYDCSADLSKIVNYLNIDDLIEVNTGLFTADIMLLGNLDTPDFDGTAAIKKLDMKLPVLTNQKITSSDINLILSHDEIDIEKFVLTTKSGQRLESEFQIFLNKWEVNHVEGTMKTVKKDLFPVKINTPIVKLNGDISLDISLYYEDPVLDIGGNIFGENIVVSSSISSLSGLTAYDVSQNSTNAPLYIRTDLNINLGTHASVNFDPILRCVFVPNTVLNLRMDQTDDSYSVDGNLSLKSGDLSYLNRNFYIKSGRIKFNPNDISNPLITINAETRERDEKGQNVKIILNVENQYLLDFVPKFSSIPAKSENEIRALLGQIVVADSTTAANFFVAASDYAIQSTIVRGAENKLRDLLNFDIFSLRTNVIQNTYNLTTSKNMNNKITVGNLLDNSTVYIGKYLGSSLYLDAMLHVSFEDRFGSNIASVGSLIFQPEFGMELESPFTSVPNIRVNMAPDINALLNNQFVPTTSVTLSWKYAF